MFCNIFAIVDTVEGYSNIMFFQVLNERKGGLWVSEKPKNQFCSTSGVSMFAFLATKSLTNCLFEK